MRGKITYALVGAVLLLLPAAATAAPGMGTSSYSAPRSSYSPPARMSAPSYKPSSYSAPSSTPRYQGRTVPAYYLDPDAPGFWGYPGSPYHAAYLDYYNEQEISGWAVLAVVGGCAIVVLGFLGMFALMERR